MHCERAENRTVFALTFGTACALAAELAFAATAPATDADSSKLQEVVVTGSLIPQVEKETSAPVTVISADDIETKGFANVAEALQHSNFATGSVQGPQFVNGFTPGAQTLSLFGLSPSYTKYLLDGRPIADYPALYNGTDIITSISGIPTVLVDRIDVLPGGQSSIYGSDAIAGVVNIILRKKMQGPEADLRYGWTKDGGGTQRRIGLADGFSIGNLTTVIGGQYEKIDPIWGYQRPKTRSYFAGGTSPQTAERDWLVFGLFGQPNGDLYYFLDPANCANVASQFSNSVQLSSREGRGTYCGTTRSGYYTLNNGSESTQGFVHSTLDLGSSTQLFADLLLNHEAIRFNTGTVFYGTASDGGPFSYYVDPNVAGGSDLLNVQRIFSPEEAGNIRAQSNKNTTNSVRATLGLNGALGASNWKYLLDMTYTENKLTEATHLAFTQAIENFFAPIFGPNLGPDPIFGQPQYMVNYAKFYQPITPAEYASFTGYAFSYSRTEDSLARAQLTNSSLLAMPGGDAGAALLVEGGRQGWDYAPDPRFLNGGTYLYTATAGSGHRTRWASTGELRLPVVKTLSLDASARYDAYQVPGGNFNKATYNLGAEFRPVRSLLLRGRYGTAFKAPTLSDEFQGQSGFFQTVTDYYTCAKNGFLPGNPPPKDIGSCPQAGETEFGTTAGNPHLKPINAKVSGVGIVWSPIEHSAFSVDYLHWKINDEVQQQDSDQLMRTDSACLLGQLDPTSPTCVAAISQVQRDANGLIVQFSTPKENLAVENLNVLVVAFNYLWELGRSGSLELEGSYSDILKHSFIRFPGDPEINYLTSPFYSTEFKTKENVSATWNLAKFGTTVYVEHYGRTPNNAATLTLEPSPGSGTLQPWTIVNWSAKYEAAPGLVVSFNVDNVFNKEPPFDPTWTGIDNQPYNIFNYNDYGRSYFIDLNYKFTK
ncbi:MAG: TonB-dependent receptor [Gammaproteobacteria bacterium]|nr:TonB-dependent receptor [Gammaproteobacteria bacterium]